MHLEQKGKVLFLLNAVKSGHILKVNELETLKKSVQNVFIGLSKLLHFNHPKESAIYKPIIFSYRTENKSSCEIDKPQHHLDYINEIKSISKNKEYETLHDLISRNFEYNIYPTRAIKKQDV